MIHLFELCLFCNTKENTNKKKKEKNHKLKDKKLIKHDCHHHIPDAPLYKDATEFTVYLIQKTYMQEQVHQCLELQGT